MTFESTIQAEMLAFVLDVRPRLFDDAVAVVAGVDSIVHKSTTIWNLDNFAQYVYHSFDLRKVERVGRGWGEVVLGDHANSLYS